MWCLVCRRPGPDVCDRCRADIQPVAPSVTQGGIPVWSWARHESAARVLVRRLKYEAVPRVAALVAVELVGAVPAQATCLVPVARTLARRVRYGIDPAAVLASALSERSGLPVVHALAAPVWMPANAGARRAQRRAVGFRTRRAVNGAVLVDDVATTGTTLDAAARALGGAVGALTATRAL